MKIPGLRLIQKAQPEATVRDGEPIGFISQSAIDGLKAGKRVQNWILPRKSEHADYCEMSIPIYTHPTPPAFDSVVKDSLTAVSNKTAPEDGPVGYITPVYISRKDEHVSMYRTKEWDWQVPLYTHPDNSELRKAAEELLNGIHERNLYSASMPTRFWDAFDNLRAVLEGK